MHDRTQAAVVGCQFVKGSCAVSISELALIDVLHDCQHVERSARSRAIMTGDRCAFVAHLLTLQSDIICGGRTLLQLAICLCSSHSITAVVLRLSWRQICLLRRITPLSCCPDAFKAGIAGNGSPV